MNQELGDLVAAQIGNGGAIDTKAWVKALAQHGSDPLMAMLVGQMLNARNEAPTEPEEKEEDLRDRQLAQARRALARARQEIASAEVMARYIADAFGTCEKCWGLNRLCGDCGGKGGPGYKVPDIATLRAWVEPALQRMGLAIVTPT